MAIVQGIREKVHAPVYDCLTVEAKQQLREAEPSSTLKFFVDVQRKTKLQTNLQSASLLPHYNTFEARAMRVVISDLPPTFPEKVVAEGKDFPVTDDEDTPMDSAGKLEGDTTSVPPFDSGKVVTADVEIPLDRLIELLKEAKEDSDGVATLDVEDEDDD